MRRGWLAILVFVCLLGSGSAFAQTPTGTAAPDSATVAPVTAPPPAPPAPAPATTQPKEKRIYYGGSIGLGFWGDYTRISLEPLVGFKLTPRLSVGGKIRYEYLNYHDVDFDAHNYGASVFSRFRLLPPLYAHAEFATMSYDFVGGRETVPFLLLGGGYSKPLGPNTWLMAEVLVDVLQDDNSPYEDWEPLVSIGVGVGF